MTAAVAASKAVGIGIGGEHSEEVGAGAGGGARKGMGKPWRGGAVVAWWVAVFFSLALAVLQWQAAGAAGWVMRPP